MHLHQPVVWVDLDETLITSTDRPSSGSVKLGTGKWAVLRPGARECLAALRHIGNVRLLTFAPIRYAAAACERFGLGFAGSDTFGHEMWTSFLAEQPSLGRPDDVLVEDDESHYVLAKCRFIGISPRRVVLVRAYRGGADDELAAVPVRALEALVGDVAGQVVSVLLDRGFSRDSILQFFTTPSDELVLDDAVDDLPDVHDGETPLALLRRYGTAGVPRVLRHAQRFGEQGAT
jgi:hypothetical protein